MPSGMYQVELDLPIDVIWNFIKDMDNWAPLVPHYIQHEKLNDRQSTWEFKSDTGILKKKLHLMIDIKEWVEPTLIRFDLKGKSEKYGGEGYFEAQAIHLNRTRLTGFLEVKVYGKMGHAVHSKLETTLPKSVEEMAIAICTKLAELKNK